MAGERRYGGNWKHDGDQDMPCCQSAVEALTVHTHFP